MNIPCESVCSFPHFSISPHVHQRIFFFSPLAMMKPHSLEEGDVVSAFLDRLRYKNNRLQRYLSISHGYPCCFCFFADLEMLISKNLGLYGCPNSINHNNPSGLDFCSPRSYHFPSHHPRPACTPSLQKTQLQCPPRSPTTTNNHPSPSVNSSQPSLSPAHHSCLPLPRD